MSQLAIDMSKYAEADPRDDSTDRPTAANSGGRIVPAPRLRRTRSTRIFVAAYIGALPAIAAFLMWLTDPQSVASFLQTEMGMALFYAGFIWTGIGMLAVRRMVFSRTIRPRLSPAW